jgi:TonB-dependent starch-binding outer membrane protein SusC
MLTLRKTKLAAALKEVETKTDYRFAFSNLVLSDKMKVTLKAKGITVKDLLTRLLDNTGLSYSLMDNNLVVITKMDRLIYADITVRGKVTDNSGGPLANVSVTAGDKSGTTTNEQGEYAITVDENATLSFSYVGYTSQQVQVNKRSLINIVLVQLSSDLTDVVVVGYSSQSRRKLTSAVVTVTGEELNKRVATNPAALGDTGIW